MDQWSINNNSIWERVHQIIQIPTRVRLEHFDQRAMLKAMQIPNMYHASFSKLDLVQQVMHVHSLTHWIQCQCKHLASTL